MDGEEGGAVVRMTNETIPETILGAACGRLIQAFAPVAAFSKSPMAQARTLAVIGGVHAAVSCIMERIRGREDAQTRMAAGFGVGATLSLLTRTGKPYVAVDTILFGVIGALVGRCIKFQPTGEYTRTRCMLSNLGLQDYEKNFKKGLLTDITIPLLTESTLKDVGVPPGPRLIILDHIQRDPELQKMRRARAG
ncbi:hypothetical protein MKW94_026080 [Papaver nudicaule]|uniref:SAM domain-containing protein n=1 Tax=Papaver nudicaule TaxID=74823 RepID=A0AA41RSC7_PAPNU|nr:hypothetical protein [Papaver nudicaule]